MEIEGHPARGWLRAPAPPLVEAFADGPFAGFTAWVRDRRPAVDLHLWSDRRAATHHADVVAGTVPLLDLTWDRRRFSVAPRRPFNRLPTAPATGWRGLGDSGTTMTGLLAFLDDALGAVPDRAGWTASALGARDVVTQRYAPVGIVPLDRTAALAAVRQVAGEVGPLSAAPDAVAIGSLGEVELVRVHGPRSPDVRWSAAQALLDLLLFEAEGLSAAGRAAQLEHLAMTGEARHRLGLAEPIAPDAAMPAVALVVTHEDTSARLLEQAETLRERLAPHLPGSRLRFAQALPAR